MIDELLKALNNNAGAVAALAAVVAASATAIYAGLTWGLLQESRRVRRQTLEAHVEAAVRPWERASWYVVVRIENLGPAPARNLDVQIYLWDHGQRVTDQDRHLAEPFLGLGSHRTFLIRGGQRLETQKQMAERDVRVDVRWSWDDQRSGGLRRSTRSLVYPVASINSDYYEGSALIEPNVERSLEDISKHLKDLTDKVPKEIKAIHDLMDSPAMQLWAREAATGASRIEREAEDARLYGDDQDDAAEPEAPKPPAAAPSKTRRRRRTNTST